MVENIRLELANFQQTLGSQGTNIVLSNENDLATLVAEKLFVKIKEDLIASGTSVIGEELNGMKDQMEEHFDLIEESIEDNKEASNQQLERNSARIQVLENDKPMKIYFSAYNDAGGEVTGELKFPKVVTNLGSAFDGPRGVFKAPVKGVFTFTFSGQQPSSIGGSGSNHIDVFVKRNGTTVFVIRDDTNSDGKHMHQNINSIFSLELDENDTVQLVVSSEDKLYAKDWARLIFIGQLVVAT